jgi:uncharacterized protein (DUF1810 family)
MSIIKDNEGLQRFVDAQEAAYEIAYSEIKKGKKQSHWMWYIFPQIQGLGISSVSKHYAIKDVAEAKQYLRHQVLGPRLISLCEELLRAKESDAYSIFGSPDDLKLKSSMTLFSEADDTIPVFKMVLEKFFNGSKDIRTMELLGKESD